MKTYVNTMPHSAPALEHSPIHSYANLALESVPAILINTGQLSFPCCLTTITSEILLNSTMTRVIYTPTTQLLLCRGLLLLSIPVSLAHSTPTSCTARAAKRHARKLKPSAQTSRGYKARQSRIPGPDNLAHRDSKKKVEFRPRIALILMRR